MKKLKVIAVSVSICLSVCIFNSTAFAGINNISATKKTLNSGDAIVKELNSHRNSNGIVSIYEKEKIFSEANSKAIGEYNEILKKEVNEKIDNLTIEMPLDKTLLKREIPLKCGSSIEIILNDEEDQSLLETAFSKIIPVAKASVGSGTDFYGYKKFGNRRYTAEYRVKGGPASTFHYYVIHRYNISKKGLKTRSVSDDYQDSFYVDYIKSKVKIEDGTASSIGGDIDALGLVKYKYKILGIDSGVTDNAKLRATIKLVKLDKKNKRAKIRQHYKSWLAKFYSF